ncbi:hypothetical protein NRB20_47270 [Nocardia sp. RB20]|uniref:Lipase n=2 Tax=Nocardia macrotermitis TaxID=2585198 RepID=A0A7K0D9S2_9NOCA|nr:hypothetical protein [Nocardia macrotermitis]
MIDRFRHSPILTALATAISAAVLTSAPAQANPVPPETHCSAPVVLVHDTGRNDSEFSGLAAELHRANFCTKTFTYGASTATPLLGRTGITAAGLSRIEDSAAELSRFLDPLGPAPISIVAHGAGSLVAQYVLQHQHPTPKIRTFVTIGPMWQGTDIGQLREIENLSRAIGTYDTVLAAETPLIDPLCGGCREIISGSSFLTELHHNEFPTAGIDYTDIVTTADGLVVPPQQATPGIRSVTVQQSAPRHTTDHFALPDDSVVQRLTVDALRHPIGPLT